MAAFSSNGPAIAGGGDLLKPDITAPGVDVIAAVSPVGRQRQPVRRRVRHIDVEPAHRRHRGAADRQAPDWSPMAVKSAMMTTASQTDNAGKPIARPGLACTTPHR